MSDVNWSVLLGAVVLWVAVGYVCGKYQSIQLIESCQKEHNVYECELVAVPKEQSK